MGAAKSKFREPWTAFLQVPLHKLDYNSWIEGEDLFIKTETKIIIINEFGEIENNLSIKYNITKNILYKLEIHYDGYTKENIFNQPIMVIDKLNYDNPICLENIEFLYKHRLIIVADILNAINHYKQSARGPEMV